MDKQKAKLMTQINIAPFNVVVVCEDGSKLPMHFVRQLATQDDILEEFETLDIGELQVIESLELYAPDGGLLFRLPAPKQLAVQQWLTVYIPRLGRSELRFTAPHA